MIDVSQPFGHGDEFVLEMMRDQKEKQPESKRFAILNKIDLLKKNKLLPLIQQYSETGLFDEIVPVSAAQATASTSSSTSSSTPSARARPSIRRKTSPPSRSASFAAEIVREKLLQHTSDELPYTTAVAVDRWEEEEQKNLIKIYATIVVERKRKSRSSSASGAT